MKKFKVLAGVGVPCILLSALFTINAAATGAAWLVTAAGILSLVLSCVSLLVMCCIGIHVAGIHEKMCERKDRDSSRDDDEKSK